MQFGADCLRQIGEVDVIVGNEILRSVQSGDVPLSDLGDYIRELINLFVEDEDNEWDYSSWKSYGDNDYTLDLLEELANDLVANGATYSEEIISSCGLKPTALGGANSSVSSHSAPLYTLVFTIIFMFLWS